MAIFKKYTTTPNKTISQLNWETLIGVHRLGDTDLVRERTADFKKPPVLPELMSLFGGDYGGFVLKRTDTNKISPTETLLHWIELAKASRLRFRDGTPITPDALRGILNFCCVDQRSMIIATTGTQLSVPRFNSAVPLVLSAFKEYRSIPYKQWNLLDDRLDIFVDRGLADTLQWSESDRSGFPDRDTLLEYLDAARTFKTGVKAGTKRSINATYTIARNEDEDFSALHNKLRCLLLQTWVFQPHAYTDLGIFNIDDIDAKPVNLVTGTILAEQSNDDDWLAPRAPRAPKVYGQPRAHKVYEPKPKPQSDEGIPWE